MYLGLRSGSFFGGGLLGTEFNTELLNYGVTRRIPNEEIDYRLEALVAYSIWRNFDFPNLDPQGEEQYTDAAGTAGVVLLAGLGQVSDPGVGDEGSMLGVPVAVRAHYMPWTALGVEIELETHINMDQLYLVGSVCVFLNYGPRQMPLTVGLHYRTVTDDSDTLHLIGVGLGGF